MFTFTYMAQPPKRYTFEQPKFKEWVEHHCMGLVLNLFAGKVKLNVNEVRVDIDPDMPAEYHMDALDFVNTHWGKVYDTVILDPPYNVRKAREKYQGRWIGKLRQLKDALPAIIRPQGRVISLGYDTVGMSRSRGFEKIAICVICHNGDHNDTLCVVEEKIKT
jgi:hypothetical protein